MNNLNIATSHDELEPVHQSGTMRISPLRPVDRAGLVGDWHLEQDVDAIEPHRSAPTRPVPMPSDAEQAENVVAQLAALETVKRRLELRLVELGAAIHGGGAA